MLKIHLLILINLVLTLSYYIEVEAHLNGAYNHDSSIRNNQRNWMKKIPDAHQLRQISIPGTHDSMAFYGGDAVQCQSASLMDQLNAGIRYLDIRCRHFHNEFAIHHGFVFQKAKFNDVLNTVKKFLTSNPSECILMRVGEEYKAEGNTRSFEETFNQYRNQFKGLFRTTQTDSTLKTCRGKIVVLKDFSSNENFGEMEYKSLNIQDSYNVGTNWDLYSKWEKVKSQLNVANNGRGKGFFVNHLSASGGSFPYFIASGHVSPASGASRLSTGQTTPGFAKSYPDFPRVNCFIGICTIAFEGTNILAHDYIVKNKLKFVGIVISDFPGKDLINAIIACNK